MSASDGLMIWMYAEPLQIDNRNDIDLVAAGKNENAAIGWFEAPVNTVDLNNWKWHEMSPVGWAMSIFKRDMDNDGDIDIVISDRRGELRGCRWLENPGLGKAQKQPWKNHFIGAEKLEIMFMSMTDLNGDGVEEAVVCERSKQTIKIFTRLDKSGIHWKVKSIQLPASTGSAKSVEIGDINNDGINDLVVSTNTNKDEKNGLIWLNGKTLTEPKESDWQNVAGIIHAKYDKVELIDLDEDGDLDVLICEENNGEHSEGLGVVWYENQVAVKSK